MAPEVSPNNVLIGEVRPGSYCDSIVLMELQVSLAEMAGVLDAGVVMATPPNLDLLRENDLLLEEAASAREEDLVIAVRAESEDAARGALAAVDELLTRRRGESSAEYLPRSLDAALAQLPEARWVLVSVPGRYAADVARDALRLDRSVFLYSDNVSCEDEAELKREAVQRGQLVLGPDCGTALIGGAGFGFVNRVRPGSIGIVGSSGTGLQTVASLIHQRGGGVSQILGAGGRDLSSEIGASTTIRALRLLGGDPSTEVVVLVSKPPETRVARRVIDSLIASDKPAVVYFQGLSPKQTPEQATNHVAFARSLEEAVDLSLSAAQVPAPVVEHEEAPERSTPEPSGRLLRGLFSGGTLALEMLLHLRHHLRISSNLALGGVTGISDMSNSISSNGHTVLDLGADEFTVGRLHPMIDFDLRLRRLATEAADPEVRLVFLDVVLGDGAHADPGAALESAIRKASQSVEVVALVIGTDEDPQDMEQTCRCLTGAGARVFRNPQSAFKYTLDCIGSESESEPSPEPVESSTAIPVSDSVPAAATEPVTQAAISTDPELISHPVRAINVGLESFYHSLRDQGVEAVHVDWRPPAGGNQRLADILKKMKS